MTCEGKCDSAMAVSLLREMTQSVVDATLAVERGKPAKGKIKQAGKHTAAVFKALTGRRPSTDELQLACGN